MKWNLLTAANLDMYEEKIIIITCLSQCVRTCYISIVDDSPAIVALSEQI